MKRHGAVVFLLAAVAVGRADILMVQNLANTIVPDGDVPVRMVSEKVVIRESKMASYTVEATFVMKSLSNQPVEGTMAFPINNLSLLREMRRTFKASMDGKPVTFSLSAMGRTVPLPPLPKRGGEDDGMRAGGPEPEKGGVLGGPGPEQAEMLLGGPDQAPRRAGPVPRVDPSLPFDIPENVKVPEGQYPAYFKWAATWAPGQQRTVTVTYDAGMLAHARGLARTRYFTYVVKTGALWKDTIGKASFSIEFRNDPKRYITGNPVKIMTTYDKQAKWVSKRKVAWEFSNWEPKEDITIRIYGWHGYDGDLYRAFALPKDYAGDKTVYTSTWLDELVEKQIEPWREIFPKEVKRLDKAALRAAIADILYHEVLARHGYAFVIGKFTGDRNKFIVLNVAVTKDGMMMGPWYGFFTRYGYHGGWYRADRDKTREQVEAELNKTEKANLAFLLKQGAEELTSEAAKQAVVSLPVPPTRRK